MAYDAADGTTAGAVDLFGQHSTLVSYFWMFGPQRERPCSMYANWLGAVATLLTSGRKAALSI